MNRRSFIRLLGGTAAAWPLAARAQQATPRVGLLTQLAESDLEGQARLKAFRQGLQQFGWLEGKNISIEYRFGANTAALIRQYGSELVGLSPHIILVNGGSILGHGSEVRLTG